MFGSEIILPDDEKPGSIMQYHVNAHMEATGSGADVDLTPVLLLANGNWTLGSGLFAIQVTANNAGRTPRMQIIPLPIREYETRDHVHLDANGLINFQYPGFVSRQINRAMVGVILNIAGSATNLEGSVFLDAFQYDEAMPIHTPMGV